MFMRALSLDYVSLTSDIDKAARVEAVDHFIQTSPKAFGRELGHRSERELENLGL